MSRRFEKAREYTEKYKDILLPCHICGNKEIWIVSDKEIFPPKRNVWSVVCTKAACECTGTYTGVKEAIRHWNEINRRKNEND